MHEGEPKNDDFFRGDGQPRPMSTVHDMIEQKKETLRKETVQMEELAELERKYWDAKQNKGDATIPANAVHRVMVTRKYLIEAAEKYATKGETQKVISEAERVLREIE